MAKQWRNFQSLLSRHRHPPISRRSGANTPCANIIAANTIAASTPVAGELKNGRALQDKEELPRKLVIM